IHRSDTLGPAAVLRLLERCDAIRKPQRFAQVLLACECDARGRLGLQDAPYPQAARLQAALEVVLALPTREIAEQALTQGRSGREIGERIHAARVQALARHLGAAEAAQ
ncbi:MAG: multifunctional CCA tRNA nucleotidyl transferase/2'3'-cyclic phosphodiesterase/2'nucleotidase/phosphatase, partial [Hylemonella sp.]